MAMVQRLRARFRLPQTQPVCIGEDPKEFEKLHRDLIAEFVPQGALEDHIIAIWPASCGAKKT